MKGCISDCKRYNRLGFSVFVRERVLIERICDLSSTWVCRDGNYL